MIIYLIPFFKFLLPKSVTAIAIWPFIVCKHRESKENTTLINHEKIHLRQQIELLILPFYIIYLLEYLYGIIRLKDHDKAYRNISFEREAYQNDCNQNHLSERKFWQMWRHYS